jgi:hypothetical protein
LAAGNFGRERRWRRSIRLLQLPHNCSVLALDSDG